MSGQGTNAVLPSDFILSEKVGVYPVATFAGDNDWALIAKNIGVGAYQDQIIRSPNLVYDSGWKTINVWNGSYGLANTSNPAYRPQIRVVGRTVFMNGTLVLPLDNGAGGLDVGGGSYPNQYRSTLYQGAGDGWEVTNQGYTQTRGSIVPTALRPIQTQFVSAVFKADRTINPSVGNRIKLTTVLIHASINSAGFLRLTTIDAQERDGISSPNYQKNSLYRFLASRFNANDRIMLFNNYFNSYNNLGTIDQRTLTPSASFYNFSCDATLGTDLGGFVLGFNTSWQLSQAVTIEQIKGAFDLI